MNRLMYRVFCFSSASILLGCAQPDAISQESTAEVKNLEAIHTQSQYRTVCQEKVTYYKSPQASEDNIIQEIGSIREGNVVTLLGKQTGQFLNVDYGGFKGWVHQSENGQNSLCKSTFVTRRICKGSVNLYYYKDALAYTVTENEPILIFKAKKKGGGHVFAADVGFVKVLYKGHPVLMEQKEIEEGKICDFTPNMISQTHKLKRANFTRTNGREIKSIVLHNTLETFSDSLDILTGSPRQVSSHYLLNRDGKIHKIVNEKDIAHHAKGFNNNSIGIEIVAGPRGIGTGMTTKQEQALKGLIIYLAKKYNMHIPSVSNQAFSYPNVTIHRRASGHNHTNCPASIWKRDVDFTNWFDDFRKEYTSYFHTISH